LELGVGQRDILTILGLGPENARSRRLDEFTPRLISMLEHMVTALNSGELLGMRLDIEQVNGEESTYEVIIHCQIGDRILS
jgi:hypothetical protein